MLRRPRPHLPAPSAGFTRVELMVTVAVIGILAMIAVPSFSNLIRSHRVTASANELVALLQTGRAAAISNRVNAEVCPSQGTDCGSAGRRWIVRELRLPDHIGATVRTAKSPVHR